MIPGRSLWLVVSAAVGIVAGCSDPGDRWTKNRPPVFPGAGIVLLDGAPLDLATVTFRPTGGGPAAFGRSDAQGRFVLTTFSDGDGVVAGEHQVVVEKYSTMKEPEGYDPDTSPPLPPPVLLTRQKYSSFKTSGFTATVTEGGPNEFEFRLAK